MKSFARQSFAKKAKFIEGKLNFLNISRRKLLLCFNNINEKKMVHVVVNTKTKTIFFMTVFMLCTLAIHWKTIIL